MNDFMQDSLFPIENLGFTGSRHGMTHLQRQTVEELLQELDIPKYVHHGDCVGADADFHKMIREHSRDIFIVGHPPLTDKHRAFTDCDIWREPLDYLPRDEQIVIESDFLIATSWTAREVRRSGTWATIRYARRYEVPHRIILPDGSFYAS